MNSFSKKIRFWPLALRFFTLYAFETSQAVTDEQMFVARVAEHREICEARTNGNFITENHHDCCGSCNEEPHCERLGNCCLGYYDSFSQGIKASANCHMNSILEDIGLGDLNETFVTNRLTPNDVTHLTDAEFSELGIDRVGDRVRLREKCRDFLKGQGEQMSPVARRLAHFQMKRRKGNFKNNRKPKTTRMIQVGWKHKTKGVYKQVTEGRGGGKYSIEVPKDTTLENLKAIIAQKYFPYGENLSMGLKLQELNYFLATFTGQNLPTFHKSGNSFTFGEYLDETNSSPVRLYLHTEDKDSDEDDQTLTTEVTETKSFTITIDDVSQGLSVRSNDIVATDSSFISAMPSNSLFVESLSSNPSLEISQTPRSSTDNDIGFPVENSPPNTEDSSFVSTGTPTVSFSRRRLQMSRNSQRSEGLPTAATQVTSEGLPPAATQVISEDLPPAARQVTSEGLPPAARQVTSEGLPPAATQVTSEGLPTAARQVTSEGLPTAARQVTSEGLPTAARQVTSEGLPTAARQVTSEGLPTAARQVTSEGLPTAASQVTSEELPTAARQVTSEGLPPAATQVTSEGLPQDLPDIMEVIDSEDEELQAAIENSLISFSTSLQDNGQSASIAETTQLRDVVAGFAERAVTADSTTKLLVSRTNVLKTTFEGMKRLSFNLNANLYIKFSGEKGVDHGGPRREFFRLALDALHESALFQGPEGNKLFNHNIDLLEKNHYRLAGQLVALSIAQDGPGPRFFNEHLFDLMVGVECDLSTFQIDVLHTNSQDILQQLIDAGTQCDIEAYLVKWGDWLVGEGIQNVWRCSLARKEEFISKITKLLIYYRMQAEITAFVNGLDDVSDLGKLIASNPQLFKPLFCYKAEEVTRDMLVNLLVPEYSDVGSNRRAAEEQTIYCLESFLQDIEDSVIPVSFGQLLAFITGADHIPPRGLNKLSVQFFTQVNGEDRLPFVSTCALEIHLPRGVESVEHFRNQMTRAVQESLGFENL